MLNKIELGEDSHAQEVKIGQIIAPFISKHALIPVDLTEVQREEIFPTILSININLEVGLTTIPGTVEIWTVPESDHPNAVQPLGEAKLKTKKIPFRGTTVTEVPCILATTFRVSNKKDLDLLSDHYMKVYLEDEVYYMDCNGYVKDDEFEERIENEGPFDALNTDYMDSNDELVDVVLPMNINALKRIRVQFLKYDDDNDDPFIDLVPLQPDFELIPA